MTGHYARYPDIADHGLIGDLQTAALVATDGTVDWFCCPRFDSPSVFASLLDADRGGYFRVGPDRDDYVTKQHGTGGRHLAYSSHTQLSCVRAVSLLPLRDCPRPGRTRQARLCPRRNRPR